MFEYFEDKKSQIAGFLKNFLNKNKEFLSRINYWEGDSNDRIFEFTRRGKMIRGGLVCLSTDLFGSVPQNQVLAAAAAMELFQSGLLIHDDIMDQDTTRRGSPSLFYQYVSIGENERVKDPNHFGYSMGICLGDAVFFLAYALLTDIAQENSAGLEILELCNRELYLVGIAQMNDVYFGSSHTEAEMEDILNLYKYKTGRYTFSLPLITGAILSGCNDHTRQLLEELGENMGIIFQIKDDEIGFLGETDEIGKPAGSDISQNKKTLIRHFILHKADLEKRSKLEKIFGKNQIQDEELQFVKELFYSLGIKQDIDDIVRDLSGKVYSLLEDLPIKDSKYRQTLHDLVEFNLHRTK